MTIIDVVLLALVTGICGSIGQAIAGPSRGGCLVAIAVGFIGALLGMGISRWTNLPEILSIAGGDQEFPIVWSIARAAVFVAVLNRLTPSHRPPNA